MVRPDLSRPGRSLSACGCVPRASTMLVQKRVDGAALRCISAGSLWVAFREGGVYSSYTPRLHDGNIVIAQMAHDAGYQCAKHYFLVAWITCIEAYRHRI